MLIFLQTPTPFPDILIATPPNSIEYYLALAEKYGLSMLLLGVVIVFLVQIYKQQNARFDKLFDMVTTVKESVPDPNDESIGKVARLSMIVKGILREAQMEFGCEWVHLWQLHNGIRVPGKHRIPLMFASLTYEIFSDTVESVQIQFAQVPMSMIEGVVNILWNNPIYVEKITEDGAATNPITKVMFSLGAKKVDFMAVLDDDGKLNAIFCLCWLTVKDYDDEMHNKMKAYSTRLSIALGSYDSIRE